MNKLLIVLSVLFATMTKNECSFSDWTTVCKVSFITSSIKQCPMPSTDQLGIYPLSDQQFPCLQRNKEYVEVYLNASVFVCVRAKSLLHVVAPLSRLHISIPKYAQAFPMSF